MRYIGIDEDPDDSYSAAAELFTVAAGFAEFGDRVMSITIEWESGERTTIPRPSREEFEEYEAKHL